MGCKHVCQLSFGKAGKCFLFLPVLHFIRKNAVDPKLYFTCMSSGRLASLPRNTREATHTSFALSENVYTKYF